MGTVDEKEHQEDTPWMSDEKYVALRNEIIDAHRSAADFLKWKLIAVASVASVGVGFWAPATGQLPDARLIICLIPLICAYVDMVHLDLAVRVQLIATFLRNCRDPYENYVDQLRGRADNPFDADMNAVHGSSIIASVILLVAGIIGSSRSWSRFHVDSFITSGVLGIVATAFLRNVYESRKKRIGSRSTDK